MFTPQEPGARDPLGPSPLQGAVDREDISDDFVQTALKNAGEPLPFVLIFQPGFQGIHVGRQAPFSPQVIPRILVGWSNVVGCDTKHPGQQKREALRIMRGMPGIDRSVRKQRVIVPNRRPIPTPITGIRPPWQRLAGIPLSLPKMEQSAGSKSLLQPPNQGVGEALFLRPDRSKIPLFAIHVINGNKRRLTSHREAHVAFLQFRVQPVAE